MSEALRGNDLLNKLNEDVRKFLDDPAEKRREIIEKYMAWIKYYDNLLENCSDKKEFPLYGNIGTTDLDGIKFQRAFWFEAMIMFIQKKEKKQEICRSTASN